jgi:hypothetical protein
MLNSIKHTKGNPFKISDTLAKSKLFQINVSTFKLTKFNSKRVILKIIKRNLVRKYLKIEKK